MTKQEAIEHAGSISALARILGVNRQAVQQYERIPQKRLEQLRQQRPEWFYKRKEQKGK